MLKKTVKYTDFNGDEVEEDIFFHLSQAELVELELSKEGGFVDSMKKIIADNDGKSIIAEFKKIILMAYGKKSSDGKRFIKNQELRDEFESSEAYSTLFVELVTDAEAAANFVSGVIPANLAAKAAELGTGEGTVADTNSNLGVLSEPETITRAEFVAMSKPEMDETLRKVSEGIVVIGDL